MRGSFAWSAVLIAFAACGHGGVDSAAAGGAAESHRDVVITLLHTNDLHGRAYYPGEGRGVAKIATLARRIRAKMPNVLLLDGGDIIHGTPVELAREGKPILAAMNAAGYDAAVVGNHEFDFGQRVTRQAIGYAAFPLLSANVLDTHTGEPWGGLRPFIIRELGGVRVAIFGLTTPRTIEIEWPRTIDGILFADAFEVARDLVERLRDRHGAELIIALTHLGLAADTLLARAVPGIDVILGGHSHTRLDRQVWIGNTLVAQTGAHAATLGRVDLLVRHDTMAEGGTATEVSGRGGRWWGHDGVMAPLGRDYPAEPLLDLADTLPDDPAVVAAYTRFAQQLEPHLDSVLTVAVEPLPSDTSMRRETALGNLFADAVRAHARTDVAVFASSQIDPAGLAEGPVRVRDLYSVLPAYTRQHIVLARAPGGALRRMLERASAGGRLTLHISGLERHGGRSRSRAKRCRKRDGTRSRQRRTCSRIIYSAETASRSWTTIPRAPSCATR